jgi:flagellum-specific peptidoglycan hydrolase FlgJ
MRKWIGAGLLLYALLSWYVYFYKESTPPAPPTTDEQIRAYIQQYKQIAQEEMRRSGVPASITLAQGILESRYGTSALATKANNHFGIKIGGADWKGGVYYVYTKEWSKKLGRMVNKLAGFRAYDSAAESFSHHSDFLTTRPRYSELFKLPPTDFEAWAHGLERTGYATDPEYGEKLVSLVQRFELAQYDQPVSD